MLPQPSVVLFSYGAFAATAIDTLARLDARVAAVVVPGNRSGSDVDVVRERAERDRLPVWTQPARRDIADFDRRLRDTAPDVAIVWSYTMVIPASTLAIPRRGTVNVHGGLLPQYRGPHVMNWVLINGEHETGVTLHYVDAGVDTGPIVAQSVFPIGEDDDAASLREKLMATGAELLSTWWPAIAAGTAPRVPQDEWRARYWPRRSAADGAIDWNAPASSIRNLVRALVAPWPGAFAVLDGRRLIVRGVRVLPTRSGAAPGTVLAIAPEGMTVATADHDLLLTSVEDNERFVRS